MAVVWQWIVQLYAMLAVVPFLPFVVILLALGIVTTDRKKAFGYAADITTFLLIGSVSVMYDKIFHTALDGIWLIVLGFVIGAGLLGSAQSRRHGTVDYKKVFRAVWRIGFLLLGACYVFLLIISVASHLRAV